MLDFLAILKGSVKIKISIKPILNGVIDQVLQPALEKAVDDTSNKFDDLILAQIYPGVEAQVKASVGKKVDELVLKIPESLRDYIEIE